MAVKWDDDIISVCCDNIHVCFYGCNENMTVLTCMYAHHMVYGIYSIFSHITTCFLNLVSVIYSIC